MALKRMSPAYFDHNATTPLDERVLQAMLPFFREQYGNASSRHEFGRSARKAVDDFFADKRETVINIPTGQCLIVKA